MGSLEAGGLCLSKFVPRVYQQLIISHIFQHPRPVFLYHIIASGTVDALVLERMESKREVQDLLLEALKKN